MRLFIVRFAKANGKSLPVARLNTSGGPDCGIVFKGEESAWPRGVAIRFSQQDPTSGIGWRLWTLRVKAFNGGLLCIPQHRTGPSKHKLEVRVGGMKLQRRSKEMDLSGSSKPLDLQFKEKPVRRIQLIRANFDPDVKRIIKNSYLDRLEGQPVNGPAWAASRRIHARRRACLLNLLTKLSAFKSSAVASISTLVEDVFLADFDRIYVTARPGFLESVRKSGRFQRCRSGGVHEKLLERIDRDYPLVGFREKVQRLSMQIVISRRGGVHAKGGPEYADIDIDLGNPYMSLSGLAIHFGEVLHPDKTNHLNMHKNLAKSVKLPYIVHPA